MFSQNYFDDGGTFAFRIENKSSDTVEVKFGEAGEDDGEFDYNKGLNKITLPPGAISYSPTGEYCLIWYNLNFDYSEECTAQIAIVHDDDGWNDFAKLNIEKYEEGSGAHYKAIDNEKRVIKMHDFDNHLIMEKYLVDINIIELGVWKTLNFVISNKPNACNI